MTKLLLLAGAAMMAASPAIAKPDHKGAKAHVSGSVKAKPVKANVALKANSKATKSMRAKGYADANLNGVPDYRERRLADANLNGIPDYRERKTIDLNRNGIADWRERWVDGDRDGIDDRHEAWARKWGVNACPPGLAKKVPACIPPGQVGRSWAVGERMPRGYSYTPFGTIPTDLRTRYELSDQYRYVYRDNRIYVIDPQTSLVSRIIDAIL